jgi:hypothetical protein
MIYVKHKQKTLNFKVSWSYYMETIGLIWRIIISLTDLVLF